MQTPITIEALNFEGPVETEEGHVPHWKELLWMWSGSKNEFPALFHYVNLCCVYNLSNLCSFGNILELSTIYVNDMSWS